MDGAVLRMDEPIGAVPAALPIATPAGWRRAGQMQPGDAIWCVDAGPQPLSALRHLARPWTRGILVPLRALGNPVPVMLPPDQPVALDLDQAAELYGDPVALVPAEALVGWRGIAFCTAPPVPLVQLAFARRQVVYAGPGLLLGFAGLGPPSLHPPALHPPDLHPPASPLTAEQGRHLIACVMAEEVGSALRL